MPRHAAPTGSDPLHVSLVAIPEATVSTLTGIFDVMNAFSMLSRLGDASFDRPPFRVEIVGLQPGPLELASQLPVGVQVITRPFDEATMLRVAHAYEQATTWHTATPSL